MTDLESLSARLLKVELQYQRMRRVAAMASILLAALLIMGQANPRPFPQIQGPLPQITPPARAAAAETVEDKIRAKQFVLVDEGGKERASLVADGAGSVFFLLFDANQKPRAEMSVSPFGPSIQFYDASGKPRTVIGSTSLIASHVANESGVVERTPPSSIVLFDSAGKLLWRTP
jgi:hypothetical protein